MAAAALLIHLYEIINLVNGKRYLGITTTGHRRRYYQHTYEGRRGKKGRLYAAMRHYGVELFRVRLLKVCASLDDAKAEELRLIALWKPEYNCSTGGESAAGRKMPRDAIERMAARFRGKPNHFRGKKHTPEARAKMAAATAGTNHQTGMKFPGRGKKTAATREVNGTVVRYWLGKNRSAETRQKISAAKIGKPRGPVPESALSVYRDNMRRAAAARRRAVICIDDGKHFASVTAAAAEYGLTKAGICSVLRGRLNKTGGRRFIYDVPDQ